MHFLSHSRIYSVITPRGSKENECERERKKERDGDREIERQMQSKVHCKSHMEKLRTERDENLMVSYSIF